jgi:hypothetical protein
MRVAQLPWPSLRPLRATGNAIEAAERSRQPGGRLQRFPLSLAMIDAFLSLFSAQSGVSDSGSAAQVHGRALAPPGTAVCAQRAPIFFLLPIFPSFAQTRSWLGNSCGMAWAADSAHMSEQAVEDGWRYKCRALLSWFVSWLGSEKRPKPRTAPPTAPLPSGAVRDGRPVRRRRLWRAARSTRGAVAACGKHPGDGQRRLVARAVPHARGAAQPLLRQRRREARAPGGAGGGAGCRAGAQLFAKKRTGGLGVPAPRRRTPRGADAAPAASPRCWWTRWRRTSPSFTVRDTQRLAGHPRNPCFLLFARAVLPRVATPGAPCDQRRRASRPRAARCARAGAAARARADAPPASAVNRMVEHCTGYDVMEILGKNWCVATALPGLGARGAGAGRAARADATPPRARLRFFCCAPQSLPAVPWRLRHRSPPAGRLHHHRRHR